MNPDPDTQHRLAELVAWFLERRSGIALVPHDDRVTIHRVEPVSGVTEAMQSGPDLASAIDNVNRHLGRS